MTDGSDTKLSEEVEINHLSELSDEVKPELALGVRSNIRRRGCRRNISASGGPVVNSPTCLVLQPG